MEEVAHRVNVVGHEGHLDLTLYKGQHVTNSRHWYLRPSERVYESEGWYRLLDMWRDTMNDGHEVVVMGLDMDVGGLTALSL